MDGADDQRLRRVALQIAIQLPADSQEAIQVLRFTDELARFCVGSVRRESLQIANQLPADSVEARKVLRYVEELLTFYLADMPEDVAPRSPPRLRLV